MKKTIALLFVLSVISALFTGCSAKDVKEPVESQRVEQDELIYNLNKDAVSSKGILQLEQIDIPEFVNGYSPNVIGIYSGTGLLVVLYDDHEQPKELGVYDFENQEYNPLFLIETDEISVEAYDENFVVYQAVLYNRENPPEIREIGPDSKIELRVFNCKTGEHSTIHEYSKEYYGSPVYMKNQILLNGNEVYFDDMAGKDDVILYRMDLNTMEVVHTEKSRQNPVEHNEQVLSVGKSDSGKYDTLYTLDNKPFLELPQNLGEFSFNGDSFFTLILDTNDESRTTTWTLTNHSTGEEILQSSYAISRIGGNASFLTWMNFNYEKPVLYSIQEEKFLILDGVPEGYNLFYLDGDNGLLINYNDKGERYYYYFHAN